MKIVTAGYTHIDIDAFGGCVAYAELLNLLDDPAQAVCIAPFNDSVPQSVRDWDAPLARTYQPNKDDTFVLIDISDEKYFEKFVDLDRIAEIIDHHPGFNEYWHKQLGDKAHIEFVGAACTLVYERWVAAGMLGQISQVSARLLATGILDNTLNFKAQITSQRDTEAYNALKQQAGLPQDWPAQYFTECQAKIVTDIRNALRHDTKHLNLRSYGETLTVGQLTLWDVEAILREYQESIIQIMDSDSPWFVNLIDISEGVSYFICTNPRVKTWLEKLLGAHFDGIIGKATRPWLRKEIIKQDLNS